MFGYFRRHVGARLAVIWLAVAVPLFALLIVTYAGWYASRLTALENTREVNAREVAFAFELLLADLRYAMRSTGGDLAAVGPSSKAADEEMRRLVEEYPVREVVFADTTGRVVASNDPALEGSSVSEEPAFRIAMASEDGAGVEPSHEGDAGAIGFHVAQAIPSRPGRPTAVMLMFVDVRRLNESFPEQVASGGIGICDSAGQVVFQNEDVDFALSRAKWGEMFPFWRQALEGDVAVTRDFHFPGDGRRIGVFVPIETIGWAAGSSVEPRLALSDYYSLLGVSIAAATLIVAVGLGISAMTSRGIRGALGELAEEARRVGSGGLDEAVRTTRQDEIGDVARSLESARVELLASRERADRELETTHLLLLTADSLASRTELDGVLGEYADVMVHALPYGRIEVALRSERGDEMTVVLARGEGTLPSGALLPLESLSPAEREALDEGRARVVDYDEPAGAATDGRRETYRRLGLVVPLVLGGRTVGMARLDDPGKRTTMTEQEFRIAVGVSAEASTAVENARLLAHERERARLAAVLTDIDALLHSTLDIDEIAQRVLGLAAEELESSSAGVAIREDGMWWPRYVHNLPEVPPEQRFTDAQFPVSAMVERERDVVTDYWRYPDMAAAAAKNGHLNGVHAPLMVRGRFVGEIGFHRTERRPFSPAQVDFVRRLSASFALAMDNAGLYESERDIADRLQGALLSLPEELPGIEFAFAYRSATETARVGGDFYDVFDMGGGRIGMTIGDVAGKGLDAAVLTSLVKHTIRALASESGRSPARILSLTNGIILAATPPEAFVTVLIAELDCGDGRLVHANAGHTAAALLRPGSVSVLPVTGPILGAFPEAEFGQTEASMGIDDVLFLYTDGLTEARADGTFYGEERLMRFLARIEDGGARAVIDDVLGDVLDFAGGELSDDLAILAVRRLEPPIGSPRQQAFPL